MFHNKDDTVYEVLQKTSVLTRRGFLKLATYTAAAIGLEYTQVGQVIAQLE